MNYKFKIVLFLMFAFSCGPKKGIVTKKKQERSKTEEVVDRTTTAKESESRSTKTETTKPPSSVESYILRYASIAKSEMQKSGVPASITLAQGILESASGRGRLAVKANNHFGIKCHGWKGAKIYHDDDRSQECFRKYKKASSSYEDHSDFLTGRRRYANLFKLKPDDYKGWARGLRAAGYATDRKYPQKLISLIERYQLYKYDDQVLNGTEIVEAVAEGNLSMVKHVVSEGDTLYSLSRYYKTTVEAIKAKNNLSSNTIAIGQELIIPN